MIINLLAYEVPQIDMLDIMLEFGKLTGSIWIVIICAFLATVLSAMTCYFAGRLHEPLWEIHHALHPDVTEEEAALFLMKHFEQIEDKEGWMLAHTIAKRIHEADSLIYTEYPEDDP